MLASYSTLGEMIEGQADKLGDLTFLTDAETRTTYTYAEVCDRAANVATTLHAHGVREGDAVATVLPNSPALVVALAGIFLRGAVAVPLNHEYRNAELSYGLEQSDATVVLTDDSHDAVVEAASEDIDVKPILTSADGTDAQPIAFDHAVDPVDTAVLLFTSGTTGAPKAVALSHANVLTRFEYGEIPEWVDTFYTMLPLYNVDGLATTFGTMYAGRSVLLRDGFSASAFWTDVEVHEANATSVVPSILAILNDQGYPGDAAVSPVEFVMVSGSYVPEEVVVEFEATFDVPVVEIYGLSEAAGTSQSVTDRTLGSAGTPVPVTEVRIVDQETREPVSPDEPGEIVIRGPTVFKEYYENTTQTREAFEGQWFKTGDVGYLDEVGELHVVDRIKNIIIRGGQNIYPGDIEDRIHTHPAVEDVAVVGEPHDVYGEVPVAYVTVRPDDECDGTEADLINHCEAALVDFKVPEEVHIVDELPRGETGKILKEEL